MPTAAFSVTVTAKAEVICGVCDRTRVADDHPQAVMCECGKTVKEDDPLTGEGGGDPSSLKFSQT